MNCAHIKNEKICLFLQTLYINKGFSGILKSFSTLLRTLSDRKHSIEGFYVEPLRLTPEWTD